MISIFPLMSDVEMAAEDKTEDHSSTADSALVTSIMTDTTTEESKFSKVSPQLSIVEYMSQL